MSFVAPKGWRLRTLTELAGIGGLVADGDWIESKDQDQNGDVRLVQLADIGDGEFHSRSARFLTGNKTRELRCTMLETGDLLVARMPDPLGRACLFPGVEQPSVTAVDIFIWRAGKNAADPRWLMHTINSPQVREHLQSISVGTTRLRVSGGNLKRLALPTPPKATQVRLAAKVDTLMNRTRRAQEDLATVSKLVHRYRQAILHTAYTEAENSANEHTTLAAIADEVRNGVSRKPDGGPDGIPILKISAVRAMRVRLQERRYYAPLTGEDVSRYSLMDGDLLFTRYNGNAFMVANCGVVRGLDEQVIYPDKLIRVRVNERLASPEFIEVVCSSPQARSELNPFIKSAAGQHGISGGDLKRLRIPLPSKERQAEILSGFQRSLSTLEALASETDRATLLLSRLAQAALAKAFLGELLEPCINSGTSVFDAPVTAKAKRGTHVV